MAQLGYSNEHRNILDKSGRERIGKQILKVLEWHLLNDLSTLSCLDVGCSAGIITNFLASRFRKVTGVDIDKTAINIAKNNYKQVKNVNFMAVSGEKLPFASEIFDVVICNQVYNFVDDARSLVNEIYRVLKPGGICYFSGRNKLSLIEPQYKLPALSLMGLTLGRRFIQITGKGREYFGSKYMTYWALKNLVSKFNIIDYTFKILEQKFSLIAKFLPRDVLTPFLPNYIWVLKKG